MGDPVYDFLNSGGNIPKSTPAQESPAENDDPVHNFLASGGSNIKTVNQESKGYFQRVYEAGKAFNESGKGPLDTVDALGEGIMQAGTAGPVSLLKHGVEEGAYLSGQSPEQAQSTAQRVIPTNGYQPVGESGKALSNLVSTAAEPLVDAGKWAAEKAGLSPAAQNIAGDFAPVVIPKAAAPVIAHPINSVKTAIALPGEAVGAVRGAASDINAQFKELQRVGRGETPQVAAQPEITPQMARGQEPIPDALMRATNTEPRQPGFTQQVSPYVPKEAPPLTVENASPELKKSIAKDIESVKPGETISQSTIDRHLAADALPVPMQLSEGQATGNLHKLSNEFNMRAKQPELANLFNEQNGRLIQNVNAIRERAAPEVADVNHVDNGAALMDSYAKLNAAREAEVSANYKALADANNGQIPVDGKAFVEAAKNALGDGLVNRREFLPASVEKIVERIGSSDKQMTFDDFTTLRTILAKEAMKASRAGDGNASHAISLVRNELENIPMGEGAEALKPLADTAKNLARALFRDIESDPAWDASISGRVTPDNFVKKYVINGARDHLSVMKQNIGSDPVANQTIAASALNYLKERAGVPNDTGNFSQAGYNKALTALKPKLDSIFDPVSAQQVQLLGDVARYTQEQPRGSYFNNSNTFVSAAKGTAKAAAEGALNIKTFGISGAVKGAIDAARQNKAAQQAVKPGAGVKISDIPKG